MSAFARSNRLLWTYDETVALISIFEEKCIQDALSNTIRNFHVYDIVSSKMKEMGYFRTPNQCRVKVKNLKSEYRGAKSLNYKGEGKKIPVYFPLLEGIFGPRSERESPSPPYVPLDVAETYGRNSKVPSTPKGKNVPRSDNFSEQSQWKQRYRPILPKGSPDSFYIDEEIEEKSPLPEELDDMNDDVKDEEEEDEAKDMEWSGLENKQKPLSSKAERKIYALKMVMESITNQFLEHQEAAEQRFYEFERERMQHEAEMEEKRMMFLREEIERQNQDEERREATLMQVLERILMFFENSSHGSVARTSKKT